MFFHYTKLTQKETVAKVGKIINKLTWIIAKFYIFILEDIVNKTFTKIHADQEMLTFVRSYKFSNLLIKPGSPVLLKVELWRRKILRRWISEIESVLCHSSKFNGNILKCAFLCLMQLSSSESSIARKWTKCFFYYCWWRK